MAKPSAALLPRPAHPDKRIIFPKDSLCGWLTSFWDASLFAFLAIKFTTEMFGAPFRRRHPRSYGKRRFVANVLSVPARKVGNPIAVLAMVKASDLSQRHLRQAEREQRRARGYDHVLLSADGVRHR